MTRPHSVDELLWHMKAASRDRSLSSREREFAADMARRSRWRNWRPTEKQSRWMRSIVQARLETVELIED